MGVLAGAVAALALAGCYAPSVRDCTVRCASAGDCAGGQVCGADGLCAAPEIAGRCGTTPPDASGHDARPPGDAEAPRDAIDRPDAGIDATATVSLHVQIMGKGAVIVDGRNTCSSLDPQRGDCAYDVVPGVAITAHAVDIQADQTFTMGTSPTCAGQSSRCMFTPMAATTITAKFGKTGMHVDLR